MTAAPGMTPPALSVTVPEIDEVADCANAAAVTSMTMAQASATRRSGTIAKDPSNPVNVRDGGNSRRGAEGRQSGDAVSFAPATPDDGSRKVRRGPKGPDRSGQVRRGPKG